MAQNEQMVKELLAGQDLRAMFMGAYRYLEQHVEEINSLNVFPVPDGDTGSNMLLTMKAVQEALLPLQSPSIGEVAEVAAMSALFGARGNSGVILSQLLRGISRGLKHHDQATSQGLSKAFQYGIIYAYRAVARPVEGTILTVAKQIAKGARTAVREGLPIDAVLRAAIDSGEQALQRTRQQLPALKQAGVVDAGGKGLLVFIEGCYRSLNGELLWDAPLPVCSTDVDAKAYIDTYSAVSEIRYPYCTEVLLKGDNIPYGVLREGVAELGDSLVMVEGDKIVKIHIHTDHPGTVLELALQYGSLHRLKIDNMREQHEHRVLNAQELQKPDCMDVAVVAVAPGDGIGQIFHELGADLIVAGGQTMNPAVNDFMNAIQTLPAKHYIILANNKNITMAVEQLRKLTSNVHVVPSRTVPQGLAAMLAVDKQLDVDTLVQNMTQRLTEVKSGALTQAVRNATVQEQTIQNGDYLALLDEKIVAAGQDIQSVLLQLMHKMVTDQMELLTIYYGQDMNERQAQEVKRLICERYPDIEVELLDGGQPHYQLIISAE